MNKNDFKAFIQALLKYHPKTSFEKRNQCILLLIVLGGLRKFEALNLELKNIALENPLPPFNQRQKQQREIRLY